MPGLDPQLLEFLLSRGKGLEGSGVDPVFAQRLQAALQAGEKATGSQTQISDLYRSPERQARYYEAYKRGEGGLAAPPGRSRHQLGQAADIRRGPVRDWMAENSSQYGIEPLKGPLARLDPVHFQMMRDWKGQIPSMPQGMAGSPMPQPAPPPVSLPQPPSVPGMQGAGIVNEAIAATQGLGSMADKIKNFDVPNAMQLGLAKMLPASMTGADSLKQGMGQGISSLQNMLKPPPIPPPISAMASAAPGVGAMAGAAAAPKLPMGLPGIGGIFSALAGLGDATRPDPATEQRNQQAISDADRKRVEYWLRQQMEGAA